MQILQYSLCRTIGRAITVRHKEHLRYIRNNNPTSAYAMHILHNRHEFGPVEETLKTLKTVHQGHKNELLGSVIYEHAFQTRFSDP